MCKSMDKGAMWPFGGNSPKVGTNRTARAFDGVCAPGSPPCPAPSLPNPSPITPRPWVAGSATHPRLHRYHGGAQTDPLRMRESGPSRRT